MIRKAIILLSLCCAVLCAFVGYLSYNVTQESKKAVGEGVPKTCEQVLKSPLSETSRIKLTDFAPGKHIAQVDNDLDNQWDRLCVPFFPRKHQKVGYGYCAVLVCFKDVKTREALDALIENGELDINFWPERQQLDRAIHSQLAQQYRNLDLAHSPVLYYGFDAANPVLGESSMYASAGAGCVAIFVAFLAMISGLFKRTKPNLVEADGEEQPTTNRAGLPKSEGPSIFDQVTSTRSVLSE
jgi:hypothetical protein